MRKILTLIGLACLFTACSSPDKKVNLQWSTQKANEWFANEKWPVGTNFTPSTAINTIEMWDAETYDSVTIDKELGWIKEFQVIFRGSISIIWFFHQEILRLLNRD